MKKLFITILSFVLLFCFSSCGDGPFKKNDLTEIILQTGEHYFIDSYNSIRFCGMISKDIFTISTYNKNSTNIYYPKTTSIISFDAGLNIYDFEVIEVNSEYIKLKFINSEEDD